MSQIDLITTVLSIIPIIGVLSDLKQGKIKNTFVFPYLVALMLLTFWIEWFYVQSNNIIEIGIVSLFWFLFYIHNKWWAWDGKYLIILGLSVTIIGYLRWFENGISYLFTYTFSIISLYIVAYILKNYRKIGRLDASFLKFHSTDFVFTYNLIFLAVSTMSFFFKNAHFYLLVSILFLGATPFLGQVSLHRYLKIIFNLLSLAVIVYYHAYGWYVLWFVMYALFLYISKIGDEIFSMIDVQEIRLVDIQQWNILTKKTLLTIQEDTGIRLVESPLQWEEVYKILERYKNSDALYKNITIYKDIKIGIWLFAWYIITVLHIVFLTK